MSTALLMLTDETMNGLRCRAMQPAMSPDRLDCDRWENLAEACGIVVDPYVLRGS